MTNAPLRKLPKYSTWRALIQLLNRRQGKDKQRVISEAVNFMWYSETNAVSPRVWVFFANAGGVTEQAMQTAGLVFDFSPARAHGKGQINIWGT